MPSFKSYLTSYRAPFFWALFPVLVIFSHNLDQLELTRLILPLTASLLLALLSCLGSYALFRHHLKAAAFTSVWLVLFFSFGYIYLQLGGTRLPQFLPFSLAACLSVVFVLILFITGFSLYRYRSAAPFLTTLFSFVGGILVLYNTLIILPFSLIRLYHSHQLSRHLQTHQLPPPTIPIEPAQRPDIYYFVFDRYARHDILDQYFDFDNRDIIDHLTGSGFFIADQSYANYPTTFLSLASTLNMDYLPHLPRIIGAQRTDHVPVYRWLISDNLVVRFLRSQGYQYLLAGDFWDATKTGPLADHNYNLFQDIDEFHLYIYERTWLNTILGILADNQIYTGILRLRLMGLNLGHRLDYLNFHIGQDRPLFVLAHFLTPHDPNVFDHQCQPLTLDAMRQLSEQAGYLKEIECINLVMRQITQTIKDRSPRPYVIIFQSDEGPYLPPQYFNHDGYVLPHTPEAITIHTAILSALYLSDPNDPSQPIDYSAAGFYPHMTPVNTFRLIFNTYFNTRLPLLPDHVFLTASPSLPYTFLNAAPFLPQPDNH